MHRGTKTTNEARLSLRHQRWLVIVAALAIPTSVWVFDRANSASFASRAMRKLLGPRARVDEMTSAPDYWQADALTMMLCALVAGLAMLYLLVVVISSTVLGSRECTDRR